MIIANDWKDYELIDTSSGEKLERWGDVILRRPDPQIVWNTPMDKRWNRVDGWYHRSNSGGGSWEFFKKLPETWTISYKDLKFVIKPMNFKHTGLFPEQAVNWDWMIQMIRNAGRPIRVLNLFAYTGGASVACAYAGASVCHVDASKRIVSQAKENLILSGLGDKPVRFIVDDVVKFVEREIRRGKKYDAIVMDPPSYGKGTNGEVWDIEKDLYPLILKTKEILSEEPLFYLINSYTAGLAPTVLKNILELTMQKGEVSCGEIGLPVTSSKLVLPCGIYGRWWKK
ncbi:MAG: class I SAM-dependent methyltransferase [Clostridia bacterium]|nr:class I SAM-dependent methyltransferase [Clostridia bacterium]